MNNYIFTSARLGFRNWRVADLADMFAINSDKEVMAFFPALPSEQQTYEYILQMQKMYKEKGYCYFAVDELEHGSFIGFVGLSEPAFEADFLPAVDIGWRIRRSEWNKGFATEGAKACLNYAFNTLGLDKVIAIAPLVNARSEQVMKKIGMQKIKEFIHPRLINDDRLKTCVLYQKLNSSSEALAG